MKENITKLCAYVIMEYVGCFSFYNFYLRGQINAAFEMQTSLILPLSNPTF